MVEAQAGIALPAHAAIVPEGVERLLRVELAQRVGPAAADQPPEGGAAIRMDQRVVVPGPRLIDVEIGRRNVEVAGKHDGRAAPAQRGRMLPQPFQPGQLVVEFRPGPGISVWRVDGGDQHAAHGRLDVARLNVGRIARQFRPCQHGCSAAGQDGHAVPRPLAGPDGVVAGPGEL